MNIALMVLGIGLVLTPGVLFRERFVPASHLIAIARATVPAGLLLIFLSLVATAAPMALRAASLTHLASLCERLIAHTVVGGTAGATVGGIIAVLIGASAVRGLVKAKRDQQRTYVDAAVGTHVHGDCCTLVVLPTPAVVAFANPGSPPQVVMSSGALETLTPTQQHVVIEHERAHINKRHHIDIRLIGAARASLHWLPGSSSTLEVWRDALEWQADDLASEAVNSRMDVAETIRAWIGPAAAPLAFNGAEHAERRLRYLLRPPSPTRFATLRTWSLVAALWVTGGALVTSWVGHAHAIATSVAYCPI